MNPWRRKEILVEYMRVKMFEEDWHGVSDAANDLRDLEVEIKMTPPLPYRPDVQLFEEGQWSEGRDKVSSKSGATISQDLKKYADATDRAINNQR